VKRSLSAVAVLALVACTLVLTACPPHESLASINRDPGRYAGREITIGGRVVQSIGALGFGFFKLDDGTGTLWVYSQNFGTPQDGSKVAVVGRVDVQGVSVMGHNYGMVFRETQRRHSSY
jgi:hypothetical protein